MPLSPRRKCKLLYEQLASVQQLVRSCAEAFGGYGERTQDELLKIIAAGSEAQRDLLYVKRVLRHLIDAAEKCHESLSESLLTFYASLISVPIPDQGWIYKRWTYGSETGEERGEIAVRVSRNLLQGGTGCKEWEAGILLGMFVLNNPSIFQDRCVLELGCGVGLTGICLAKAKSRRCILTDGNQDTLENCAYNLQLNSIPHKRITNSTHLQDAAITIVEQNWASPCTVIPDVTVGADLLYDERVIPLLVKLIHDVTRSRVYNPTVTLRIGEQALQMGSGFCLLLTVVRNESTMHRFFNEVAAHGLAIIDISDALSRMEIEFFCLDVNRDRAKLHVLHCTKIS